MRVHAWVLLLPLLAGCELVMEDPDALILKNSALLPVEVSGNRLWSDADAGFQHSCALTTDGEAFCWGNNDYLQTGNTADVSCGYNTRCLRRPTAVLGGHRFVQIVAGGNMSCGLTAAGAIWCWGGGYGDGGTTYLGNGTLARSATPLRVASDSVFVSVSRRPAGGGCALTASGQAWCWGENGGSLGDGSTTVRPTPVPIGGALRFTRLVRHWSHSCGITTSGALYCWGDNRWGQLAIGDVPWNNFGAMETAPVPATTSQTYTDVAVGGSITCAIRSGGLLECAGTNANGVLGDGSSLTHRGTLGPVAATFAATQVSANEVSVCALATDGSAYCWGGNWFGGLGIGTRSDFGEETPQRVQGGPFAKITVGGSHSCGLTPGQRLYCWGHDGMGAVGRN